MALPRPLLAAILAGAALLLLLSLPSSSRAGSFTNCGVHGPTIFIKTKALNVSCQTAKRVARKYALKGDRSPLGFTCREPEQVDVETLRGRCRRDDDQRVKFIYGP